MNEESWNKEEIDALNWLQKCGIVHPYTCGGDDKTPYCREDLIATENGWICPKCSYTQKWHMGNTVELMNNLKSLIKNHPIYGKQME